ncbi:hypothetical protein CCZ01_06735 [Helicobacter monodelphidis]|uniref:ComF family protein n=1 Tax=Helicobacter sp. 15-1451 TaxID=2004995 RepID=UPI000DCB1E39|nr:ComF family protein [Helicobacter sp. 15-1451]RAX57267.1 hypothetical protein CCZ01_06735 [Helicobacter sp. 15-1451]
MKCFLCHRFSFKAICDCCLKWIKITPKIREIDGFKIYSFFSYDDSSMILHSKYSTLGSRLIRILTIKAANYFKDSYESSLLENVYGVGIDDKPKHSFSHTAIIAHTFYQILGIKPLYSALHAKNTIQYAGKTLEFRKNNPRHFQWIHKKKPPFVILYDDLITTGTTILEAKNVLQKNNIQAIFGITLANSS